MVHLWRAFINIDNTKGERVDEKGTIKNEQIAKAKACGDVRDLMQLAKDEGVELNEERLNAISGGACSDTSTNHKKRKIDA